MNNQTDDTSIADLLGPWVDSHMQTSLIERVKNAWNKPLNQLSNLELATCLEQNIAVDRILPIARMRVATGADDDTEFFDGQLSEAIEGAVRRGHR